MTMRFIVGNRPLHNNCTTFNIYARTPETIRYTREIIEQQWDHEREETVLDSDRDQVVIATLTEVEVRPVKLHF